MRGGWKRAVVMTAQVVAGLLAAGAANADIWDTPGAFASYQLAMGPLESTVVTQYGTEWLYGQGDTHYLNGSDRGAGTASVAARGAVGWAQAGATAQGTGYTAGAWGGWTDQISVNVAGQAGAHGTLTFSLAYDWVAPVSTSSVANDVGRASGWASNYADVVLIAPGGTPSRSPYLYAQQSASSWCSAVGQCHQDLNWDVWGGYGTTSMDEVPVLIEDGLLTYSLDVVFGQQYFLTIGMNASIAGRDGVGMTDSSSTISWAGLFSIRDSNGQLIDKNSVTMGSALGFDFSQAVTPVPEPQALLLWLPGLGLLAACARRRLH